MTDIVVRVDLRDPDLRERVLRGVPGAELYRQYAAARGDKGMAPLPLRAIVIVEIGDEPDPGLESVALGLLGSDPTRVIVALVPPERDPEAPPMERRFIPSELSRFTGVRFLELRSSLVCVGHPRTGASHIPAGATAAWAEAFERDLLGRLEEQALFDAVWEMLPADRPSIVGMRVAALGEGRELAVADLCLRLAEALAPDHEPQTGTVLPDRWTIDARLLPAVPPYPEIKRTPEVPVSLRNLTHLASASLFSVLSRPVASYNAAAEDATRSAGAETGLAEQVRTLANLFEAAEAPPSPAVGQCDGPVVSAIGAEQLDAALGGKVVFGDDFTHDFEAGEDAAHRVEEFLRTAAERQADGLSASILAHWLRQDAGRIMPQGPRTVAERLRTRAARWERPATAGSDGTPAAPAGAWEWTRGQLGLGGRGAARAAETASTTDGGFHDPGRVPSGGLNSSAGSWIWRHRWFARVFVFVLLTVTLLRVAHVIALASGYPLPPPEAFGLNRFWADAIALGFTIVVIAAWVFVILSLLAASAIRSWAGAFGFESFEDTAAELDAEVHALAVSEVARCAPRRQMACVLNAAATTLEDSCTMASATARTLGEEVQASVAAAAGATSPGRSKDVDVPPHRELLTSGSTVVGTDASGIYRLYPLYVSALRGMFSQALVHAIREWWPRVRGVFWEDTSGVIAEGASIVLRHRLDQVRVAGLRRGDLLRDGIDPAEELAKALWSDPVIRDSARRALNFGRDDPMPMLASPIDIRLLDDTHDLDLILAVPSTLESLVGPEVQGGQRRILVQDLLESATAIRIFPFKAGIYDIAEVGTSAGAPVAR